MKKYLLAATMLGAMVSTPAFADGNNRNTDTETFTLRANNPAKCNLEAADYTLRIAGNSISDNDGFARTTVSNAVANEMNDAAVSAWCTGADDFNRAVVYDVTMRIAGATRSDGFDPIEGTSDGQGNGPGIGAGSALTVSRFGPTGAGSSVTFQSEIDSTAVTDGNSTAARGSFTADSNRLVAGQYVSSLTIELTPGV